MDSLFLEAPCFQRIWLFSSYVDNTSVLSTYASTDADEPISASSVLHSRNITSLHPIYIKWKEIFSQNYKF